MSSYFDQSTRSLESKCVVIKMSSVRCQQSCSVLNSCTINSPSPQDRTIRIAASPSMSPTHHIAHFSDPADLTEITLSEGHRELLAENRTWQVYESQAWQVPSTIWARLLETEMSPLLVLTSWGQSQLIENGKFSNISPICRYFVSVLIHSYA